MKKLKEILGLLALTTLFSGFALRAGERYFQVDRASVVGIAISVTGALFGLYAFRCLTERSHRGTDDEP